MHNAPSLMQMLMLGIVYKKASTAMPTAPIATGTAVAAAPEPEEEPVADAPVAEPDADPVALAPFVLDKLNADDADASAELSLLARELASARNEVFAEPVAVAASEERDAMAEEALPLALV